MLNDLGPTLRMLPYLRPSQVWHRLRRRLLAPWQQTVAYRRTLRKAASETLEGSVPDPWPASPERGRAIVDGSMVLLNKALPMKDGIDWTSPDESLLWRFTLQYCDWFADVKALETPEAAQFLRRAVRSWIDAHPVPDCVAWHPYPLSLRIVAWLRHTPFLLTGAPPEFASTVHRSVLEQAAHLERTLERDVGGNHLVKNLKALIAVHHCRVNGRARRDVYLDQLQKEIARQVLPDGCHYELSPSYHLQVLADFLDLGLLLGATCPAWLEAAIDRMGPALAFFRHGDGHLALFNDGDTGDPHRLHTVADLLGGWPAPPDSLPDAGYHRLQAGDTLVLLDAGRCCPDDLPAHAHADMLSFEMSVARHRLIVNCGTYTYQDEDWRTRLRGTDSHSTLCIDGTDSAEVFGTFRLGRRPHDIGVTRRGNRVDGWHDGYRHLGLRHHRSLALSAGRLSGRDKVSGRASGRVVGISFHLAPEVVLRTHAGGADLTLPGGETWTLSCDQGRIIDQESWYAPEMGVLLPTRRLRIDLPCGESGMAVDWALTRAAGPAETRRRGEDTAFR